MLFVPPHFPQHLRLLLLKDIASLQQLFEYCSLFFILLQPPYGFFRNRFDTLPQFVKLILYFGLLCL